MTTVSRHWGLLGVPSSAGAHTPGLEKGPEALRRAGLVEMLQVADVTDHGDTSSFRWRPDPIHPHGQNAAAVVRVAAETASAVAGILRRSQTPLVLGGDCTITIGVVAGFAQSEMSPALLYVDGGPDLYTPETRANGNLDAMGLSHMLAIPGHLPELAGIGPTVPLLAPHDVVVYGDTLPEGDVELRLIRELGIKRISAAAVHDDVEGSASLARSHIETRAASFVVHFDADVLAFVDAPLADVPDSGGDPVGLTLDELATTLVTFVASPRFAGLVVTEVNPDHAPDPEVLRHFVETLTSAIR